MATWKPELHSAEDVLNYYDQYDDVGYSVYAGHKPEQAYCRFTYTGNDKNIGREKLSDALASILSNPDNTNVYLIQILGVKGKKLETKNAITFQLNKSVSLLPYNGIGGYNPQMSNEINVLRSEIAALKMQQEIDEEEEDEEEPAENFLSGLMQNPAVKNMIMNVIGNLVTPAQKVTHVSGIDEDIAEQKDIDNDKLYSAVIRLSKYDNQLADDLILLCEMAENDPMQFKFLLKMLRK